MATLPIERHLLRAKDLADRHYDEPIGVAAMAEAAGLSQAHFTRAFRATFGITPHGYLLTRRLERAAALLRHTDHSIADICMAVGLTSVGSFTTSFGRMFGRTPTQYRAAYPPVAARFPLPSCVVRAHTRPEHRSFREDAAASRSVASVPTDSPTTGSTPTGADR
jgi:AraC-like DNA-binding protein